MWKTKKQLIINILVGLIFVGVVLTFYTTFSMDTDYSFESDVYDINDKYIKNISVNTDIALFIKYFDLDNCTIKVFDINDEEIVRGNIPNGSKTVVNDANGTAIVSYINIIKGDFTNDGIIDVNDFYDMGKCLVNKNDCLLEEYQSMSVDMDDDGEFHINDLVLLDKALTFGYSGISLKDKDIVLQTGEIGRLVSVVEPNYGVNQNVKWSSLDESIATVDEAGRVTGHAEGETIVKAVTLDGKYSAEAIVRVDNTIQLSDYSGKGYIGGNDIVVNIKSIDYDDIICSVSDDKVADCEIKDKTLVMKPKTEGSSSVKVSSVKYGEVTYELSVYSVYFNIMPKYICSTPGNSNLITVSGFNTGELSFVADDSEIIKDAYMTNYQNKRMLRIDFGNKQGRTILRATESNGNSAALVVVDVTYMRLADFGKTTYVDEEVSTTIISGNIGKLICKSSDESVATCRIEGDQLIVTPLKVGVATIDVYNDFSYESYYERCGQSQFMIVIYEKVDNNVQE